MVQLEGDQFISRLTLMFDKARTKGHVQLTMKKYDGKTKPTPKPDESKTKNKKGKVTKPSSEPTPIVDPDFMCLIRANYRAEKISTVVHQRDVNKFQLAYCNLLKSNMDGLKRQKKTKLKKATQ
jgi:signal recognition particle subunit SRP14